MSTLALTSSVFEHNGRIPEKYTCDGDGHLSPPLTISGIPEGAKSLVLIMDDPDIPKERVAVRGIEVFDHWTLFNIPPETTEIPEGFTGGEKGLNSAGREGYTGPCPPPQYEPKEHGYIFVLYALSDRLSFSQPPTKDQVTEALAPIVLASATLIGKYSRD
jgi:Raf kinase inhibitor-like YbhB/YbcL family protein